MLSGDTVAPPLVIGPPQPTPHHPGLGDPRHGDIGDQGGQDREEGVGILTGWRGAPGSAHDRARRVDDAHRHLGAADVDGQAIAVRQRPDHVAHGP